MSLFALEAIFFLCSIYLFTVDLTAYAVSLMFSLPFSLRKLIHVRWELTVVQGLNVYTMGFVLTAFGYSVTGVFEGSALRACS